MFVVAGSDLYFDILMMLDYCLNLFANSADMFGCFGRLGLHCRHCFVVDSVLGSCLGSTDFVVEHVVELVVEMIHFALDRNLGTVVGFGLVDSIVAHCIAVTTYYCRISDLVAMVYNVA